MKEARIFVDELIQSITSQGRALTVASCEGVQWIWSQLAFVMRKVGQQLVLELKWLKMVPYRIAEAEDPEQARICADQLTSANADGLSPLLRKMLTLVPDLLAHIQLW